MTAAFDRHPVAHHFFMLVSSNAHQDRIAAPVQRGHGIDGCEHGFFGPTQAGTAKADRAGQMA